MTIYSRALLFVFLLTGAAACKPPRCPISSCRVRMRHAHGKTDYRGLPWWVRNKDPKIGEDYHDPAQEADQKKDNAGFKQRRKGAIQKRKDAQKN